MSRVALIAVLALLPGCRSAPAPTIVRVLTYNIHHGEGTDGRFDLDRLAAVISSCEPDLVALQEVDRNTGRSGGVDQPTVLSTATGLGATFGPAMEYDGGEYGEAVLHRAAPIDATTHALPHSPGLEPRAALAARFEAGGAAVTFVGTHLDHTSDPADRLAQARALVELFADDGPCILAGDLNAEIGSAPMNALLERFSDTCAAGEQTFPSATPERRIDYVLVTPPERWRVLERHVIAEEVASDHRPLLVVLELLPE